MGAFDLWVLNFLFNLHANVSLRTEAAHGVVSSGAARVSEKEVLTEASPFRAIVALY